MSFYSELGEVSCLVVFLKQNNIVSEINSVKVGCTQSLLATLRVRASTLSSIRNNKLLLALMEIISRKRSLNKVTLPVEEIQYVEKVLDMFL